jgi:hypothetical protein
MTEVLKLQPLSNLKTLTLHVSKILMLSNGRSDGKCRTKSPLNFDFVQGNPLEQEEGYRLAVLFYLPELTHLDFISVTKTDHANSSNFGAKYEPYWERRHGELEASYIARKKAAEVTYTERIMEGGDDLTDDDIDD